MSPILFGGSENRDESGCRRPVKEHICKAAYSKHAPKAYDDCYNRAIQRTLLGEHTGRCAGPKLKVLFILGEFGVIIRIYVSLTIIHIEGNNVGDGITEGEV